MFTAYFVAYFVVRLSSLQAKRCGSSFFCFFSSGSYGKKKLEHISKFGIVFNFFNIVLEITLQVFLAVL